MENSSIDVHLFKSSQVPICTDRSLSRNEIGCEGWGFGQKGYVLACNGTGRNSKPWLPSLCFYNSGMYINL